MALHKIFCSAHAFTVPDYRVIDGQQRSTTLTVLPNRAQERAGAGPR